MPYKVVSNATPDKLLSICAWGNYECSYSPDTWTTAPVGGLLCFSTLDAAKEFLRGEKRADLELWECLGDMTVQLRAWNISDPRKGWASTPCLPDHWWPAGTVAYKRVRLLKHIPLEPPAEC